MKYATKKVTKITEHLLDAAVIGITDMGNMDREKLLVVIKKVLRRCAQYAHITRTIRAHCAHIKCGRACFLVHTHTHASLIRGVPNT